MNLVTAPDGTRIVTTRLGSLSANPLIVVPGGPCRGTEYLEDLAGLPADRPVIVLHPRGTPTTGGLSRGWWNDADDLIAVIDSLGLAHADVMAHSAGTRLALAAATRFPDRISRLVLVTPPATWLVDAPDDGEAIGRARHEAAVDAALVAMRLDVAAGQVPFDQHREASAAAGYAAWNQREREHAVVGDWAWDAAAAWFDAIPVDAAAQIRAAGVPRVTVVGGDADILVGVAPVRAYAQQLHAQLVELNACGHYPWVEQPVAFRAAVLSALAD